MKLWLTKQGNGLFMLTKLKPTKAKILGTSKEDVYIVSGEPIGVRNLCSVMLQLVGSEDLEIGQSIQIELEGKVINGSST